MGRSGEVTHARILEVAYRLFYRQGFGRVSMDAVAEGSGVTKRTVYQHFESKDALLGELLARHEGEALALIREWGDSAVSETELIEAIFGGLERWAARPRWLGSGYTRLAMELADLPGHPARTVARTHKRTVEDWLAERLRDLGTPEPEMRARELMLLMEGANCLMLIHGDRSYAKAAALAARWLANTEQPDDEARGRGASATSQT